MMPINGCFKCNQTINSFFISNYNPVCVDTRVKQIVIWFLVLYIDYGKLFNSIKIVFGVFYCMTDQDFRYFNGMYFVRPVHECPMFAVLLVLWNILVALKLMNELFILTFINRFNIQIFIRRLFSLNFTNLLHVFSRKISKKLKL